MNKQVGLVLSAENSIEDIKKYLPRLDFVQVMGIKNLGKSGEPFYIKSLEKVEQLNKLKKKYNFEIIFDGSVKATNVWKINAKYIVSSSGILSTKNPIKSFMELKTNSRYTSVDKKLKRDIFLGMKKIIEEMEFVKSGTVVGSFSEGKGLKGINDIDIVLILDKLSKKNFQITLSKFEKLKTDIESKYGWPVIINNTLGPLKFNEKTIVFHLMLYDEKTHKEHCLKSPFTCFDWQNSKYFFKKPMSEICKIYDLQLKDFFNSRRSAKEYLKNLKEGKIPYRIYDVQKNNVMEIQKYKEMNSRDRIEFSYHIMKFLILNFLKLYYNKNIKSSFNNCVEKFFEIFPENKKEHTKTLNKLFRLKNSKQYKEFDDYTKVENFVIDFEKQFKQLFEIK